MKKLIKIFKTIWTISIWSLIIYVAYIILPLNYEIIKIFWKFDPWAAILIVIFEVIVTFIGVVLWINYSVRGEKGALYPKKLDDLDEYDDFDNLKDFDY